MNPLILAAFIAGNTLDLASTHYMMNRGAREIVLPNNITSIYVMKIGATSLGTLLLSKLHKNHPKLANGMAITIGSEMSIFAAHNMSQLNKR